MNVKYSLITNGKSSFQQYHCCSDLWDPVDHIFAYNMRAVNSGSLKGPDINEAKPIKMFINRDHQLAIYLVLNKKGERVQ